MENLSDSEDINRDWENIKENIKTSSKESLVLHELKPQFIGGFSDQRKNAKM